MRLVLVRRYNLLEDAGDDVGQLGLGGRVEAEGLVDLGVGVLVVVADVEVLELAFGGVFVDSDYVLAFVRVVVHGLGFIIYRGGLGFGV